MYTPAAQQLLDYMLTSAVKKPHACMYMYSSCPAASTLYAHFSCQTAPCLYTYMYPSCPAAHILCAHSSCQTASCSYTYMYPSCPAASILYAHLSCQTTPCLYIQCVQVTHAIAMHFIFLYQNHGSCRPPPRHMQLHSHHAPISIQFNPACEHQLQHVGDRDAPIVSLRMHTPPGASRNTAVISSKQGGHWLVGRRHGRQSGAGLYRRP